ncbi:MAG TPA: ribose 5-phosphate isomerase B [Phycisphaerae bacterium]|nr:ribose 5-phosphate isomerase B [Phycisphaerae bacterium]
MNIALACDHRGFHVKQDLLTFLRSDNDSLHDMGTHDTKSCDYPDIAIPTALAVVRGKVDRAILIDGSGLGMSIVANKIPGIRAAVCHDELTAEISRRHNNANVLCLAADLLGQELVRRIAAAWIKTPFEEGRHSRRLEKISQLESRLFSDTQLAIERLEANPITP